MEKLFFKVTYEDGRLLIVVGHEGHAAETQDGELRIIDHEKGLVAAYGPGVWKRVEEVTATKPALGAFHDLTPATGDPERL